MKRESTANQGRSVLDRIDWLKLVELSGIWIFLPWKEVALGAGARVIPWVPLLVVMDSAAVSLILHFDSRVLGKMGLHAIYPTHHLSRQLWNLGIVLFPLWCWGLYQALLKKRLVRKLSDTLINAGLKNPLGKLPPFIFDRAVDEFTRKLRLGRAGFTLVQFRNARESLESNLQIYIDELREDRASGSIDILYSHSPMTGHVPYEGITSLPKLTFLVGKTRAKSVRVSLRDVPHLMIAGQTGGGKSTFLRGIITTLYVNNPDMDFTLIDLKGGLEFQTFEGLDRVMVIPDVTHAVFSLKTATEELTERMRALREAGCKDIDAYLVRREKKEEGQGKKMPYLRRKVWVIDEAAEMFLAGNHAGTSDIQDARRALSQIARQGRAVGFHLMVATQRPDAKALDPQVKANLTGVLCFQMLNDSSSMTVLGTGRATDLPPVPGRGIWKAGSEMIEIQTPYLSNDEAKRLLNPTPSEKATPCEVSDE